MASQARIIELENKAGRVRREVLEMHGRLLI